MRSRRRCRASGRWCCARAPSRRASPARRPDLKILAAEADVDRVVMGTLLRAGDQLRVTAQLVEAPSGTLLTSQTIQSSMGDLFRLQDDIAHRIVEALSLPLTGVDPTAHARRAARRAGVRALPSGQRAGPHLRRPRGRPRSVSAKPRAGLALRARLGPAGPLPPRHRQVRRRRSRKRVARRRRLPPGARPQPAPVDRAQVLRESRGRHRPGQPCRRAPAR